VLKLSVLWLTIAISVVVGFTWAADDIAQSISVSRHVDTVITEAQVDNKLAAATRRLRLREDETSGDIRCCVHLRLAKPIAAFGKSNDHDDVIQDETQLRRVLMLPGARIKLVTAIQGVHLCGTKNIGSFEGCAEIGGKNIVLAMGAPSDVWAHEFGHNQGLPHRNTSTDLIMHESAFGTHEIDVKECSRFQDKGATIGPCPF